MIQCVKCKAPTHMVRSIQLRKSDWAQKGVCIPCYERLTAYRAKRKAKEEMNK